VLRGIDHHDGVAIVQVHDIAQHRQGNIQTTARRHHIRGGCLRGLGNGQLQFPTTVDGQSALRLGVKQRSIRGFHRCGFRDGDEFRHGVTVIIDLRMIAIGTGRASIGRNAVDQHLRARRGAPIVVIDHDDVNRVQCVTFRDIAEHAIEHGRQNDGKGKQPEQLRFLPEMQFQIDQQCLQHNVKPFEP
jgi:hypothetical protein